MIFLVAIKIITTHTEVKSRRSESAAPAKEMVAPAKNSSHNFANICGIYDTKEKAGAALNSVCLENLAKG